jgi:hypothetical protein
MSQKSRGIKKKIFFFFLLTKFSWKNKIEAGMGDIAKG